MSWPVDAQRTLVSQLRGGQPPSHFLIADLLVLALSIQSSPSHYKTTHPGPVILTANSSGHVGPKNMVNNQQHLIRTRFFSGVG